MLRKGDIARGHSADRGGTSQVREGRLANCRMSRSGGTSQLTVGMNPTNYVQSILKHRANKLYI